MSLRVQSAILLLVVGATMAAMLSLGAAVTGWVREASTQANAASQIRSENDELLLGMVSQQDGLRGYALRGAPAPLKTYSDGQLLVRTAARALERDIVDPTMHQLLRDAVSAANTWEGFADGRVAAIRAGQGEDPALTAQGDQLFKTFHNRQRALGAYNDVQLQTDLANFRARTDALPIFFLTLSLGGLCVLLLMAFLLFRSLLRPIGQLTYSATELAEGRPNPIPWVGRGDEVGRLARALATWNAAAEDRIRIARAMAEVSGHVNLEEVLDLSLKRLSEVVAAPEVIVTLMQDDGQATAISLSGALSYAGPMTPIAPLLVQASGDGHVNFGEVSGMDLKPELREAIGGDRYGPVMSLPLMSSADIIGAVTCLRRGGEPAFNSADAQRAEIIVPFLAGSITVAKLFNELRETTDAKSRFLALISHELRTPLNSIMGFSQMLAGDETVNMNDRQLVYISQIRSSGRRLLELINDVLDLSKVEAGRMELDIRPCPIGEVLEQCVAEVTPLAQRKSQALTLQPSSGLTAYADRRRLAQVVLNLLSNAIKFTGDDGSVTVSSAVDGGFAKVSVQDTGIGIAPEHQAVIFEEFVQASKDAGYEYEGTGLGLALSQGLMELMSGTITLQSTPGVGSTFTISIPMTAPQPKAGAAEGTASA
jgi:signal transduction histidine kinase